MNEQLGQCECCGILAKVIWNVGWLSCQRCRDDKRVPSLSLKKDSK